MGIGYTRTLGLVPETPTTANCRESGRFVLQSLGQSQIWVSFTGDPERERPVGDVNALKDGSTIRIGEHLLTFREGEN